MNHASSNSAELMIMVDRIEAYNSFNTRLDAVRRIAEIGVPAKFVIDALQRIASNDYTELGGAARQAIDTIYLRDKMRKPVAKSTVQLTTVKVTVEDGDSLCVENGRAYCRCNFCGKETSVNSATHRFTDKLSGAERFYCSFCLRHKLNHRDARHTLLMSFRGIIGYYYHAFYSLPKNVLMTISEINDYIAMHVQAGLQNPIFIYDPESFLWFVDFTRVGKGKRQLPVEDVLATIGEIILAFSLHENVKDIHPSKLYLRYEEAVLKFYHQRHRPAGSRILLPTLVKTGALEYAAEKLARDAITVTTGINVTEKRRIDFEATRQFTPSVLHEAMGKKY